MMSDQTIKNLFEKRAMRSPKSVALVFEEQELTYQELNEKANQLAHYLKKKGVNSEDLVGICTERSLEMIVGILGVLKAGGAYLPIDPDYPQERIQYLLNDANASIVLTEQGVSEKLVKIVSEITLINLEIDSGAIRKESKQNLELTGNTAQSLAYVIYTSGSTGNPKGVMIEHNTVIELMNHFQAIRPIVVGDICSLWTSISFDVSVYEIFSALFYGATLHVINKNTRIDSASVFNYLADNRITSSYLPPVFIPEFEVWLKESEKESSLKKLIVSVEPIPQKYLHAIQSMINDISIINAYGPTEATVFASSYLVDLENEQTMTPIGKTICKSFILDKNLNEVERGTPGELYIGNAGLARGYFNRPELTADKFISNPFCEGERLYKSGDIVKELFDGNIEFIGRIDNQVKIRGFRVELGEIESTIGQHNGVKSNIVLAKKDRSGIKQLVAYVVLKNEHIKTSEITQFISSKIPRHMVPGLVIPIDKMPLTVNGKVDKKSLPNPQEFMGGRTGAVAPITPMEEMLLRIWEGALEVKPISTLDNFFELGGHSLMLMKIISAIKVECNKILPVQQFYEGGNIQNIAAFLESEELAVSSKTSQIEQAIRPEHIPLSYQQQQIWMDSELKGGMPIYNEAFQVQIKSAIDPVIIGRCWDELVKRHESLRTTFYMSNGNLEQVIHPWSAKFETHFTEKERTFFDFSNDLEINEKVYRLAGEKAVLPFDLEEGPLYRLHLVKMDEEEYCLFFTMHHIIVDGVSVFNILFPALYRMYHAAVNNSNDSLLYPKLQYTDIAIWQQQQQKDSEDLYAEQLNYWTEKLKDLPVLNLPTDRPYPQQLSSNGGRLFFDLPNELSSAVKQLSKSEGVTLYTTLLTAYKILLYRYTSQEDIAVGTAHSGRTQVEMEEVVGMLVNFSVLRDKINGNTTTKELLSQVQKTSVDALMNQHVPYSKLVKELAPASNTGLNSLFQALFTLDPVQEVSSPNWEISQADIHTGTTIADLMMELNEHSNGIRGRIEYSSDLFDETTIERMVGHYTMILQRMVSQTDEKIAHLEMLTPSEAKQIGQWSHDLPSSSNSQRSMASVQELFENQVLRTPDSVALVFEGQELTYKELNEKANQLASYLIKNGVTPEDLVCICIERSLEMIVAILAILKSGGAYVPIDPNYPEERIAYMLNDTNASVILTQQSLNEKLAKVNTETILIHLDSDWDIIGKEPISNLNLTNLDANNLAYVIYTSGSTGKPKGVLIEHKSIVRLVYQQNYVSIDESDVFFQNSTISFDAATFEIWGALLNGCKLAIPSPKQILDLEELERNLVENKVSIVFITTALFHLIVDERVELFNQLKTLIMGGEIGSLIHINKFLLNTEDVHLVHAYGPTENTTFTSVYQFEDQKSCNLLSIGKAIDSTYICLLDNHLQYTPIGLPGELYTGGSGLARGYLNQPELTAQKFIDHPFKPGERLYKSGDLVQYLPDGNIEFIGRIDNQVKIRGFRIELGEIENALVNLNEIKEVVVVVKGEGTLKKLIAFVVLKTHTTKNEEEVVRKIREQIKQLLPEYMHPDYVVPVDYMPLTANGKVDKKVLLKRQLSVPKDTTENTGVQTETERGVSEIWEDILQHNIFGIDDNFFDVGGHSLLMIQLQHQLIQRFNTKISITDLFQYKSVRGMANFLENKEQPTVSVKHKKRMERRARKRV